MADTHGDRPDPHFVPALGFHWLTPLYDPLVRLVVRERMLKSRLIEQADIHAGQSVLDVGCGTGTLAIMIKQSCPEVRVVGLDGDPRILEIARRKAEAAEIEVEFVEGMAYAPPLADGSFDRALSTLVLHHLTTDEKRRTLNRLRKLLRSGGQFHIADWGPPQNLLMQIAALPMRLPGGADRVATHLRGQLPGLIEQAGFDDVQQTGHAMTMFGTLGFIAAVAP
jgi:SAM-dependent methyltransferase